MWETALAQTTESSSGGGAIATLLPFVLIIGIFYFMLIRPQQKRAKSHQKMLEALSIGDEVMTSSGIFGKVVSIGDNAVTLSVGKIEIPFQKQSIQSLLPTGSLEKL